MAVVAGWGCPCRKSKGGITEAVNEGRHQPKPQPGHGFVLPSMWQQKSLELIWPLGIHQSHTYPMEGKKSYFRRDSSFTVRQEKPGVRGLNHGWLPRNIFLCIVYKGVQRSFKCCHLIPGHKYSDSAALSQLLRATQEGQLKPCWQETEGPSPPGGAGRSHEQGSQNSEVWTCFTKGKEIWILAVIYQILNSFRERFLLFISSLTVA